MWSKRESNTALTAIEWRAAMLLADFTHTRPCAYRTAVPGPTGGAFPRPKVFARTQESHHDAHR